MESFFWHGFEQIFRIFVVGIFAYIGIIIFIRITGLRTLARMSTFDFIIIAAIGASFGRILTAGEVSVSEALTAFMFLIFVQYSISLLEFRSAPFFRALSLQPTLLFFRGQYLKDSMNKQRIRKEDILAAARKHSINNLSHIEAIVLESDGTLSVIKKSSDNDYSALEGVCNYKR